MFSVAELSALLQVIMVDLVLAGDNAIVVGMVAASVPRYQRTKVLIFGILGATILRVAFALITTQLLAVIGLMLAGGILLLWVSWKLWRDIEEQRRERNAIRTAEAAAAAAAKDGVVDHAAAPDPVEPKSLKKAIVQIIIADVSMSLDNVLAVAGIARDHEWVLIFGLALSIAFMAVAATLIARLLKKHHWLAYVGLAVIFYVACAMIWDGSIDVIDKTTIEEFLTQ
ncbi:MAG: TerC family protein [Rhodospirillaceae bacterium]|nr:TerC family protein [Rhodospirillaceae bacterium]